MSEQNSGSKCPIPKKMRIVLAFTIVCLAGAIIALALS